MPGLKKWSFTNSLFNFCPNPSQIQSQSHRILFPTWETLSFHTTKITLVALRGSSLWKLGSDENFAQKFWAMNPLSEDSTVSSKTMPSRHQLRRPRSATSFRGRCGSLCALRQAHNGGVHHRMGEVEQKIMVIMGFRPSKWRVHRLCLVRKCRNDRYGFHPEK